MQVFPSPGGAAVCDVFRPLLEGRNTKGLKMMQFSGPAERHSTIAVKVGKVTVGGGAPVVVQSMTNTDTADVAGTTQQGAELARITVDRDEAAAAVPHIKERLLKMNVDVPIVGDFHYIGHKLLADHPAC